MREEPQEAFDNAVKLGFHNTYNWMYMYSKNNRDYFKHKVTRSYTSFPQHALLGGIGYKLKKDKYKGKNIKYYSQKEIKELLDSKEQLIYVNDIETYFIIRSKDVADFIVDYNNKYGDSHLYFYNYGTGISDPIIISSGNSLKGYNHKAKSYIKDINNRLAYLKQGGKIRKYKVIDEYDYDCVVSDFDLEIDNIRI